jgi:hypothetical protein
MATLVLSTVGSAVGAAIAGPVGGAVGRVLGTVAGSLVDQSLLAGSDGPRFVERPRLKELDGLASTEGAAIPRVYGRARIGGQLIWATRFEEAANATVERTGSRGGKGGGGGSKTVRTTYSYSGNLAVGLCEGPIGFVRRVWADGRELDLTAVTVRVHRGAEDQDRTRSSWRRRGPRTRLLIAASPMSCSSASPSSRSATACRNSPSRSCARSTGSAT